ncbi:23S rRNA (cytidine(2498)-2'-O)-methyltransferase RlmM [Agarivorans sp. QJM3NY_25]|uniref:23S rRNA (cytidine(2498)-2'-O)-methyltransferase RlmM n=1 Tax=Agarivorans sp. QJM3NY_25 TaxID=3421430 RepID=UPI003D7E7F61
MTNSIILYCRTGFESDCAAEIQFHAEQLEYFGYAKAAAESGFVEFSCYQNEHTISLYQAIDFRNLIFARHWFLALLELELDERNRVASILAIDQKLPPCGSLRLEYPDTNEGKSLSAFCKKFTRPLEHALIKHQWLSKTQNLKLPAMQLFFTSGTHCWLGYSDTRNGNPQANGILRLKFPNQAPSRSTLKLDEAFMVLLNDQEREQYLENGQHAVDLGACPGGWTYQLVRRNMFVAAVDNGPMAPSLMETGQVQHFREDGFKFQPERNNTSWLVCDMVERPAKVARLMLKWLANGWCRYAMFNLKLPMKQRFAEVNQDLNMLREGLAELGFESEVRAKQLYHDREEITVFARII